MKLSCTLVVLFVASLAISDAAPAARDQPRLRKVVRRRQRQNRQNRQLHFGNRVVLAAANPAPVAVPFAPVPRVAPTPLATAAPFRIPAALPVAPTPALRFAHPAQFHQPIQLAHPAQFQQPFQVVHIPQQPAIAPVQPVQAQKPVVEVSRTVQPVIQQVAQPLFTAPVTIAAEAPRSIAKPIAITRMVHNAPGMNANSINTWDYAFESENGIKQSAIGEMRLVGEEEVVVMRGSYEYIGADGLTYVVDWIADENGFQPSAPHLPEPVAIPFPEQAAAVAAQRKFAAAEDLLAAQRV